MSTSLSCRVRGCTPDPCGVCGRCGDQSKSKHDWVDVDPLKPCYKRMACSRCAATRESPDHNWEPVGSDLKCSRCGLQI